MVANPNFYRGKPAVDEVVFKIYSNPDALGQALKKGEIDYADGLEANVYDSLADAPNIERKSRRSTRDSTNWRSTPGPRWWTTNRSATETHC